MKNTYWNVIYTGKLPIRPWCLVLFVFFACGFYFCLWILDLAESIFSLVWWVLLSYLENCLLVCARACLCVCAPVCVLCKFRLFVFSSSVFSKLKKWKDVQSFCDGVEGSSGFLVPSLRLNVEWDVLSFPLQVLRCVQEWSGLAAMKKKLLRRSGLLFHSPTLGLQQLAAAQRPHSSTKRSEVCSWRKYAALTFRKTSAVINKTTTLVLICNLLSSHVPITAYSHVGSVMPQMLPHH